MLRVFDGQRRCLALGVAALALVAAGCGSSTSTSAVASTAPTQSDGPVASTSAAAQNVGLDGSIAALSELDSYQFTMTLEGVELPSTVSSALESSDGDVVTVKGTVVNNPDPAADITFGGKLHVVSLGGFDYIEFGGDGFTKIDVADEGGTSIADSISPYTEYSGLSSAFKGFVLDTSEKKNGVDCDAYKGDTASMAEFASVAGVKGGTWTVSVWLAKDGDYPVSFSMEAKAKDGSLMYEVIFDLTKVNDASNKITEPENVVGA
jgi:hypothetical protein